jgi:hypothetical protein
MGGKNKKKPLKKSRALTNTPALGLLGMMKPFFLYVHEQKRTVIGVLM